jgi:hypothetical protein
MAAAHIIASQEFMANLNSESYHSLIGFLTPEYLGFLKLQVIPRFTGMCISPVPVNRGICQWRREATHSNRSCYVSF